MTRYTLGIDAGPRGIHAAIAAADRIEVMSTQAADPARVLDAAVRRMGGSPDAIHLIGEADLPGAARVDAAVAIAHHLEVSGLVVVCDGTVAAVLDGEEVVARAEGPDTVAAIRAALGHRSAADLEALALTGRARHAAERVRRRFGRADVMDDDAAAIGAATLPPERTARAEPPSTVADPAPLESQPEPEPAPPAAPQQPDAPARPRSRRRAAAGTAALLLVLAAAGALLFTRGEPVRPTAACQAAMDDGSDAAVERACRIADYMPAGARECDWYIAAARGTTCAAATELFAAWFADRGRDGCSGGFLLECEGRGGRRVYVMRALDVLRLR